MKTKLLFLSLALLSFIPAFSQQDAIAKYFHEYQTDKNFTEVKISGALFRLMGHFAVDSPEDQEILDVMSKIDGFRLVTQDSMTNAKLAYKRAITLPGDEFESLMTVEDGEDDMEFMIKENDGVVEELLLIVGGDDHLLVLTLFGEIDLDAMASISKKMEIDGFEHLDNIEDRKK